MPADNADNAKSTENAESTESAEAPFDAVQAAAELAAAMARPPEATQGEGEGEGEGEGDAEAAPEDKYTAILEDEVEALRAMLADKAQLLADKEQALADKDEEVAAALKRSAAARAEVDRVRARVEKRAADASERKRRSVIASFLDVADNLDRASLELGNDGTVAPALAQGVQAVRSELHAILRQHGASHRPSLGEAFDPSLHEAIGTAPATEDAPAGTIAAVLREGYDLGDEPLRVARVVVAKD